MPSPAMPRILAVIPARGGSKGFPGKNVAELSGMPLIGHSLAAAAQLSWVTRCIVTTDDDHIAAVARGLGADLPFRRPPELAADDTPMAPVLTHALHEVEAAEGTEYDYLLLLDPTSPVRDPETVGQALCQLVSRPELDGVISVSAPEFHPVWVGVRSTGDRVLARYFESGSGVTRRQQLDPYLRINGNFYLWRSAYVRRMPSAWFDEGLHGMVEIPESAAYAIDYPYQLAELAGLIESGVITLPWLSR